MAHTKHLGNAGEEEAASYLKKRGYKILERNYRTKFGEIDIVASKKRAIVFVEVKTRMNQLHEVQLRAIDFQGVDNRTFLPEDNIDQRKQSKLRKLGEYYLSVHNYPENQEWQIDVVTVEVDSGFSRVFIRHIEQAVTG